MGEQSQEEFRPANDSRKRAPVQPEKVEAMKATESKSGFGQRWKELQPTKSHLIWACVITAILTMIIGFNWGGWMSSGSAQKMADTTAKDAVVQRLVPICVAQFDLDAEKVTKLAELKDKSTSYQQSQFVRDEGWATIAGEERPDNKVADACAQLLIQ
ncbi:MAG: hypothetical protein KF753_25090 [Caldilineaceae bacterium]|nr:hypothetical protein [Caldilineaceae bacterium]